jgi:hypothetical protein
MIRHPTTLLARQVRRSLTGCAFAYPSTALFERKDQAVGVFCSTRICACSVSKGNSVHIKAISLQAFTGPQGFRRLRLPDFKTIGTWRWQGCQPYAPAAFTRRKHYWYNTTLRSPFSLSSTENVEQPPPEKILGTQCLHRRRMDRSVSHAGYRNVVTNDVRCLAGCLIKQETIEEWVNVAEFYVLSFRPQIAVRWLSRYFPVNDFTRH